jgi:hypothetical protein
MILLLSLGGFLGHMDTFLDFKSLIIICFENYDIFGFVDFC